MKSRQEVAEFIDNGGLSPDEKDSQYHKWHIGLIEIRRLMDFIYEGEPNDGETINEID